MKASYILVVTVVLCGLCYVPCSVAVPALSGRQAGDTSSNTYQTNSTNIIDGTANKFTNFNTRVADVVSQIVRCIFSTIGNTLRWFISTIESTINSTLGIGGSFERQRRLLLTAVTHPIQTLQQSFSSAQDYVIQEAQAVVFELIQWFLHFMSTRGLPWLHTTLDELQKTQALPTSFNQLIDGFDTIYDLLVLFGFIHPAS
ncbi:uncharacterized protein LOC128875398 [Hylaeus volcanicus]|uniref:uncharacterized protein LOC128875398 n=1 Tax=Hylaeus volcanicus TaxID=313075 RepID=UPI0023B80F8F|nr:uncharacterized protein LOC128875398 [Hylaeus volcanicus]